MSTLETGKIVTMMKEIMAFEKCPQSALADLLGFSRKTINSVINGRSAPSDQFTERVQIQHETSRLKTELGILKDESGKYRVGSNVQWPPQDLSKTGTRIPVISWASAGSGNDYCDLETSIDEYMWSDIKDPNSYGLIIDGDSMEPKYFEGDRIVVAPNSEARNGDDVVARVQETGEVFFKKFHRSSEIVKLTSYNRVYPELEFRISEFRFIHPVWSVVRKVRR